MANESQEVITISSSDEEIAPTVSKNSKDFSNVKKNSTKQGYLKRKSAAVSNKISVIPFDTFTSSSFAMTGNKVSSSILPISQKSGTSSLMEKVYSSMGRAINKGTVQSLNNQRHPRAFPNDTSISIPNKSVTSPIPSGLFNVNASDKQVKISGSQPHVSRNAPKLKNWKEDCRLNSNLPVTSVSNCEKFPKGVKNMGRTLSSVVNLGLGEKNIGNTAGKLLGGNVSSLNSIEHSLSKSGTSITISDQRSNSTNHIKAKVPLEKSSNSSFNSKNHSNDLTVIAIKPQVHHGSNFNAALSKRSLTKTKPSDTNKIVVPSPTGSNLILENKHTALSKEINISVFRDKSITQENNDSKLSKFHPSSSTRSTDKAKSLVSTSDEVEVISDNNIKTFRLSETKNSSIPPHSKKAKIDLSPNPIIFNKEIKGTFNKEKERIKSMRKSLEQIESNRISNISKKNQPSTETKSSSKCVGNTSQKDLTKCDTPTKETGSSLDINLRSDCITSDTPDKSVEKIQKKQVTSPKLSLKRKQSEKDGNVLKKSKIEEVHSIITPMKKISTEPVEQIPWKVSDDNKKKLIKLFELSLPFLKKHSLYEKGEEHKIKRTLLKHVNLSKLSYTESNEFSEYLLESYKKIKATPDNIFVHLRDIKKTLGANKEIKSLKSDISTTNSMQVPLSVVETPKGLLENDNYSCINNQSASVKVSVINPFSNQSKTVSEAHNSKIPKPLEVHENLIVPPMEKPLFTEMLVQIDELNDSEIQSPSLIPPLDIIESLEDINPNPPNSKDSGLSEISSVQNTVRIKTDAVLDSKTSVMETGEFQLVNEQIISNTETVTHTCSTPSTSDNNKPTKPISLDIKVTRVELESVIPTEVPETPELLPLQTPVPESTTQDISCPMPTPNNCKDFLLISSPAKASSNVEPVSLEKLTCNAIESELPPARSPLSIQIVSVSSMNDSKVSCVQEKSVKPADSPVPPVNVYKVEPKQKLFYQSSEFTSRKNVAPVVKQLDNGPLPDHRIVGTINGALFETPGSSSAYRPSTSSNSALIEAEIDKKIIKLEKFLAKLDKKIRDFSQREISLDDLDNEASIYLREDQYKRKFVTVWNKICSLKKCSPHFGRSTQKKFSFSGTRYDEVNHAIEKFINKRKPGDRFPNYSEILNVVRNVEDVHQLAIPSVEALAREVFTDIGHELKRRRQKDYFKDFGCYLTDDKDLEDDPADHDPELELVLRNNNKEGERKIDELINKYADESPENLEDSNPDDPGDECETSVVIEDGLSETDPNDNSPEEDNVLPTRLLPKIKVEDESSNASTEPDLSKEGSPHVSMSCRAGDIASVSSKAEEGIMEDESSNASTEPAPSQKVTRVVFKTENSDSEHSNASTEPGPDALQSAHQSFHKTLSPNCDEGKVDCTVWMLNDSNSSNSPDLPSLTELISSVKK